MLYDALQTVHLLAIIVWVGGMAFAAFFLHPAASARLELAQRLTLLQEVSRRFLNATIAASLITLFTGLWMIGNVARAASEAGADFSMPIDWKVMSTLGVLMVLIFGHIRFALYKRLAKQVTAQDWTAATTAMSKMRGWVFANLSIGVFIVAFTLLY